MLYYIVPTEVIPETSLSLQEIAEIGNKYTNNDDSWIVQEFEGRVLFTFKLSFGRFDEVVQQYLHEAVENIAIGKLT